VIMLFFSARSYARLKREAEEMLEPVVVSNQEERAGG
jgi:CDP-diacylglycerol---serine O-phosphatidyltransferase